MLVFSISLTELSHPTAKGFRMSTLFEPRFLATASRGVEPALADELSELRFKSVTIRSGAVLFDGTESEGWRACLQSRIASRVFIRLATLDAEGPDALYTAAMALPWEIWVAPRNTISVSAVISGNPTGAPPPEYIALKIKDAVVDRLRNSLGERPDVSRRAADAAVFARILPGKAEIFLDLCGEPLFKRGYRTSAGEAPLKETLAAAILRMSAWGKVSPLVDPMCGSGTFAIEAALWAGGFAPGLLREDGFAFERRPDFNAAKSAEWTAMRAAARRDAHGQTHKILASDISSEAVESTKANARRATARVATRVEDAKSLQLPPGPGVVVVNPPYGRRLGGGSDAAAALSSLAAKAAGWRMCVLAPADEAGRHVSLKPSAGYNLYNGDIPCRLLIYDIKPRV